MPTDGFRLDHLVCEAEGCQFEPGFSWYEIDWDEDGDGWNGKGRGSGARIIAATRGGPVQAIETTLRSIASRPVTHVQFEAAGSGNDARAISRLSEAGLTAIAARHLRAEPTSSSQLSDIVCDLAAAGGGMIKVAYPASENRHVCWGLQLLSAWVHDDVALSLTPIGGRQARLAAALAGSRLVYAPLNATSERMSAGWYRALLLRHGSLEDDKGVSTW